MIMTTFTFERVRFNGRPGWIATRRIAGVYAGKMFGETKRAAIAAFDE